MASAPPNDSSSNADNTLTIDAAHVLRLIQAHLTECGLHEACRVLQQESGVGGAGVLHSNFYNWAKSGQWGTILESLSSVESKYVPKDLLGDVHEMVILELADAGEMELAYASLRLLQDQLDEQSTTTTTNVVIEADAIPPSRILEQRLAALVALRGSSSSTQSNLIPPDYYGRGVSKKERRAEIGKRLAESIPVVPPSRLTSLLQQAVKWQAHTGQVPYVRQYYEEEDNDGSKKRKRKRKEFDLVLGEVSVDSFTVVVGDVAQASSSLKSEHIPFKVYSTIQFGKKATAECALFLPDGKGLVTGSSDGLVEIWDPNERYTKLRMDLEYQQKEELLFHDDAILALAISNDGTLLATGSANGSIKVWRVDTTGQCLREIKVAHKGAISCLAFSNDASRVLSGSHDFLAREYGLRTSKLLKEFRGHTSYVNTCNYVLSSEQQLLLVVTGSADGTVRVWDGKTSELQHVLQPLGATTPGSSVLVNATGLDSTEISNIHTVLPLHTPPNTMLVIPRGPRAYLLTYNGTVLKVYEEGTKDYVAATVSPSNQWLYVVTEDGVCHVFDVCTGLLKETLREFGSECTRPQKVEISGLVHHPHKGILGAFSNDKGQKRGVLTLWK